jgi:hypothetical protein
VQIAARIRHEVARRPWLYWAAVGVAVLATVVTARAESRQVDRARAAWGTTRDVLVATAPMRAGDRVGDATEVRALPEAMVPDAAVGADDTDLVVRHDVAPGEIVADTDVAARSGPAALVPSGWAAVPVTVGSTGAYAVGDHVAVVSGGLELSGDGLVVAVADLALVVAVPRDAAAEVASAAGAADVAVLLLP